MGRRLCWRAERHAAPQHPNRDSPGEPAPQWNRNRELTYRCKIFLFVNADLLNLFPQIPKPITLCILQKGLFFVMFLLFGLFFFCFFSFFFFPTLDTIIQNRKKPVGQILVGCWNIVQEKKNIQETISYSYLSREKYIQLIYSVR